MMYESRSLGKNAGIECLIWEVSRFEKIAFTAYSS